MAISESDLKLLWGRAAGRCSLCKVQVTADKRSVTGAYPYGENAHIVAEKMGGPRGGEPIAETLRNSYLNLILLCPNCHTKIDKSPEDYSATRLHQAKKAHETEMARLYPPDKASYDEVLQFSRVTESNWLSPDRENYMPLGITQDEWIAPFLQPQLNPSVPLNVVQAFEVARGCMIYCWFFYPLATLGAEQLARVGEVAMHERCRLAGGRGTEFTAMASELMSLKVLSEEEFVRWRALAGLASDLRPAGITIFDPGQAITALRSVTDLINGLFAPK